MKLGKRDIVQMIVAVLFITVFTCLLTLFDEQFPVVSKLLGNASLFIGFYTTYIAVKTWRIARDLEARNTVALKKLKAENQLKSAVLVINATTKQSFSQDVVDYFRQLGEADKEKGIEKGICSAVLNPVQEFPVPELDCDFQINPIPGLYGVEYIAGSVPTRCPTNGLSDVREEDTDIYMEKFATGLQTILNLFKFYGIHNILLFMSGPIVLSSLIGEHMKNQFRFYTFQYVNQSEHSGYVLVTRKSLEEYVNKRKVHTFVTEKSLSNEKG